MDVRAMGFEVKVGPPQVSDAEAHALVKEIVRRHLPGQWRIVPSILDHRLFELRPAGAVPSVAESWDLARTMAEDRDVVYAQPLLETPGLEPPATAPPIGGRGAAALRAPAAPPPPANWHIAHCGIDLAWGLSRGDGIVVGHPDTGYMRHPEIWNDGATNRVLADFGFDFVDDDRDATAPQSTHGTATASVIMSGADQPGGTHVSGTAPLARIIPIRVDNDVVHFRWGSTRKAVEWAIQRDCHVISMSLGGPLDGPSLHEAIQRAVQRGIIVIAAAGNVWPFVVYPGRYQEVLCVAATNINRQRWPDSARGPDVDVSAPGENVWRATRSDAGQFVVEPSSGTSYATAIVAGVAALWLARHGRQRLIDRYGLPNIAAVFKEVVMTQGVEVPPGWDSGRMGAGIINAKRVLDAPLPATVPARGVTALRAEGAPPVQTDFDDIAHYFPDVPRERVRANLRELLRVPDAQLDAELARWGEELKLHAAVDPQMRATIGGEGPATARGAGVSRAAAAADPSISAGLRARIGF